MGSFGISFIFSVGASAWIYNKVMQRNGGQSGQAIMVAVISWVFLMIVTWPLIATLLP